MIHQSNKRSWLGWSAGAALTLALVGWAVWRAFFAGQIDDDDEADAGKKEAAVAPVRVARLTNGPIERTLTAYGTAIVAAGGARSLSFPFECRVVAVQANVGQPVAAGDMLLRIEPSADARLALDTARGVQKAAEAALQDAQARFRSHLATNADLAAAQSATADAGLKFESLQGRLPGADGDVRAPTAGLVTAVLARPGAVIAAGGPLVEIAAENRLEARLGIAPPDAAQVKAGQAVHLWPVEARADAPLTGTVRVVGQSVDPATRMVDGIVTLDGTSVLIGSYLRAEIVVEKKEALLAPRAALLPDEQHPGRATLFTVQAGKALKHEVGVGIDDGERVEIAAGGEALADGMSVVTEGAYELEDGMAVEMESETGGKTP